MRRLTRREITTDTILADRRRLTIYLSDELYDAVCAHADAAGQKLSTFVSRELAHLVQHKPSPEDLAEYRRTVGANAKREAR